MVRAAYSDQKLQILRGISVGFVVLYHVDVETFSFGYLGVNAFFVISGFITHEKIIKIGSGFGVLDRTELFLRFIRKRILRIFPALGTMVVICILFAAFLLPVGKVLNRSISLGLYSLFGVGNIFAERHAGEYFNPFPNIFLHTWSLGVELQFYLMFSSLCLLFSIIAKQNLKIHLHLYLITVFVLSQYSFLFQSRMFESKTSADVGYFLQYHIWEFAIGIFLSETFAKSKDQTGSTKLYLPSAVVLHCIILIAGGLNPHSMSVIACVGVTGVLLVPFNTPFKHNLLLRFFEAIGNRSYSIYLWHYPLLVLAKQSPLFEVSSGSRVLPTLMALLATAVLSEISFRKVEEKFRVRS
jgi:peptidoglycan/LPS O-acetylase OafA/YrhL